MTSVWQIWIDTGGTFTDGIAKDPTGNTYRTKVLSSSCLRGQLVNNRVQASWLTAPIFEGYQVHLIETGERSRISRLLTTGEVTFDPPLAVTAPLLTIELSTGEEAPVLATRLLTQTPLSQPFPPLEMCLGTTKGTNALLERKGGKVALLVTKGFRDLLIIGTQQRPNLFQLAIPPADVLYDTVIEVDERVAANGDPITPLSAQTINQVIDRLQALSVDAIAISLLNAYQNPVHERQLKQALQALKLPYMVCSHEVSPAPHYVPRTQTTVVEAYLTPVLRSYLDNIQQQVQGHPVRVMTSAGGLFRADLFRPKDSLLSGPAGGVIGSAIIARQVSAYATTQAQHISANVLTLDMGGTSTDVARIEGTLPDYRFTTRIGSFDLQLPSLAVETVAAGGGSICWFDGSQLRVGPQSAGANPGPASYGATKPGQTPMLTITDVNLLLGKLHPAQFGIPVFIHKAQEALQAIQQDVARQTGQQMSAEQLLHGFERIADEAMAGAIRKISVSRGFNPADYSLLVFGGAGGLHGCSVARLLGMKTLILPFDGGLLSAYGIGKARIERIASKAILRSLAEIVDELPHYIDDLTVRATHQLKEDLRNDTVIEVRSVLLFMRMKGQETTIEIPLPWPRPNLSFDGLEQQYRRHYEHLYGHYPEGRIIELESIRVLVSTAVPEATYTIEASPVSQPMPAFQTGRYPAYDWTNLQPGDTFTGPALLLNKTSSAFLEKGWRLSIQADGNAVAHFIAETSSAVAAASIVPDNQTDAVQIELFARRFMAIAEEMGAQLQRTAFSVNVKERLDFSCAVLNKQGELVANAPHIPVHLGSLGVCARLTLGQLPPLEPGDVVITNHPKYGGSHLPDVTLLSGVFSDDSTLIGYVINRAHHAEIGGRVPGSMPPDATTLVEEGVILRPQYAARKGVFLWEQTLKNQFTDGPYPTRSLAENRADIEAAIASLRAGETALQTLVAQHGITTVQHYMDRLAQTATTALQRILKPLDGQTFTAEETLDDGHRICVRISISNQTITFDFSGTSAVHPHNLNANVSILHSAVLYVLRLWCADDIPLNEGLMKPVQLIVPESFLNPAFSDDPVQCPAVVGGNTEVSQRLVDTLLKALGLAACSQGTMNNFLFGNTQFGYYETIGGGTGATNGANGRPAVHQHMTNTKITDPEELERRYPVRLHEFSIRSGSGGDGQWKGGDGIIRDMEFLEPVQATLVSQHRAVAPYGLAGGQSGQTGRQFVIGLDGNREELPGIFTRPMQVGERIRIETPGGGGFGQ